MMKRKRFLIFLLIVPLSLFGQEKGTITLQPIVEYGYNYTYENYGNIAAVSDFRVADNFSLNGGLQASTENFYSVLAKGTVDIPLKVGKLYIENRYLYKMVFRNNIQDFNVGISLGFQAKHWRIQGGYHSEVFMQIRKKYSKIMTPVVEPFGIMYLLEASVFKPEHIWNIGGRMSNFDHFIMERFGNPSFTIFGNYNIFEKLQIVAETGVRPSGITNNNANFWGYYLQISTKISW